MWKRGAESVISTTSLTAEEEGDLRPSNENEDRRREERRSKLLRASGFNDRERSRVLQLPATATAIGKGWVSSHSLSLVILFLTYKLSTILFAEFIYFPNILNTLYFPFNLSQLKLMAK